MPNCKSAFSITEAWFNGDLMVISWRQFPDYRIPLLVSDLKGSKAHIKFGNQQNQSWISQVQPCELTSLVSGCFCSHVCRCRNGDWCWSETFAGEHWAISDFGTFWRYLRDILEYPLVSDSQNMCFFFVSATSLGSRLQDTASLLPFHRQRSLGLGLFLMCSQRRARCMGFSGFSILLTWGRFKHVQNMVTNLWCLYTLL